MRLSGLNWRHWSIKSRACADAPENASLKETWRVGGIDSSIVPAKGDFMDSTSSGEGFPVDSNIFSS